MSHTNSTTNYGLPEFLSSDKPAWMADINTAFATIDTQMKANADSAGQANTDVGTMGLNFAPGYSNASTYAVGDIVTYNKRVYICDVAVTVPEAFDSDKWSYYRLSDVGETANEDHELIGNTDISSVGDGTLTGAVNTLNANLSEFPHIETVSETGSVSANGTASITFTVPSVTGKTPFIAFYRANSATPKILPSTVSKIIGVGENSVTFDVSSESTVAQNNVTFTAYVWYK